MPSWKKIITSGSDAILNTVTASFYTGSFRGDGSQLTGITATVDTSSLVTTSSFNSYTSSINSFTSSINSYTQSLNSATSSFITTGSIAVTQRITGSLIVSGSHTVTGSSNISQRLNVAGPPITGMSSSLWGRVQITSGALDIVENSLDMLGGTRANALNITTATDAALALNITNTNTGSSAASQVALFTSSSFAQSYLSSETNSAARGPGTNRWLLRTNAIRGIQIVAETGSIDIGVDGDRTILAVTTASITANEVTSSTMVVSGIAVRISGSTTITGSLIVSGSSTFTNIGPAIFSGSVESVNPITGSIALSSISGRELYLTNNTGSTGQIVGKDFLNRIRWDSPANFGILSAVVTGSFATTSSNTFQGSQTVIGDVNIDGGTIAAISSPSVAYTGVNNLLIGESVSTLASNTITAGQSTKTYTSANTALGIQAIAGAYPTYSISGEIYPSLVGNDGIPQDKSTVANTGSRNVIFLDPNVITPPIQLIIPSQSLNVAFSTYIAPNDITTYSFKFDTTRGVGSFIYEPLIQSFINDETITTKYIATGSFDVISGEQTVVVDTRELTLSDYYTTGDQVLIWSSYDAGNQGQYEPVEIQTVADGPGELTFTTQPSFVPIGVTTPGFFQAEIPLIRKTPLYLSGNRTTLFTPLTTTYVANSTEAFPLNVQSASYGSATDTTLIQTTDLLGTGLGINEYLQYYTPTSASTAVGLGTVAVGPGELAAGRYNNPSDSYLLTVGNGTSNLNRSNALSVDSSRTTFGGGITHKVDVASSSSPVNLSPSCSVLLLDQTTTRTVILPPTNQVPIGSIFYIKSDPETGPDRFMISASSGDFIEFNMTKYSITGSSSDINPCIQIMKARSAYWGILSVWNGVTSSVILPP